MAQWLRALLVGNLCGRGGVAFLGFGDGLGR